MHSKNEKPQKNVGEHVLDLVSQEDQRINPIELQKAIHQGNKGEDSYESQLLECLERGKKEADGSFFVVVLFKKERLMQNVVRQYFLWRYSCPTPEYDQTVYHYDHKSDRLEYLWSVPDQLTTSTLYYDRANVPLEYQELAQMCADFLEQRLDMKCAHMNGEPWNG